MTATEHQRPHSAQQAADLARWDNEGGAPENMRGRSEQTPDVGTSNWHLRGIGGVDGGRNVFAGEQPPTAHGRRA
jgi:hypothetical protein